MINFDFFEYNPTAAAALISGTSECYECPMLRNCDESPYYNKKGYSDSSSKKSKSAFKCGRIFSKTILKHLKAQTI